MQKKLLLFVFIAATLVLAMRFTKPGPADSFAIIELFTSEGCSSCPPADAAMAAVIKQYPANVFVLGYHVDYWDRLGWKDAFSNAAWTDRQSSYAAALHLNSIYTPQAIVNGRTEFIGSNEAMLYASIRRELDHPAANTITITATSKDAATIAVSYNTNQTGKATLNMALVQLHATTVVKRGENQGKYLTHVNIVRDFKKTRDASGTINLQLPAGLSPADCQVIAFLQDKPGTAITAAARTTIEPRE
jgi:hypothetical protein